MFSPKQLLLPAFAPAQQVGLLWELNGTPYGQAVADFDGATGTPAPEGAGGARATLFPAFPNPAGAGTRIDFSLPEATEVQLAVYDVQGRRVRTLLDQRMPAGRHDLSLDGTDDGGARVASGAYYYELRIPGQQPRARKLLQLR